MSTMIVDSSFHVDLAEQLVILVLECNLSRIPTGHNGYPKRRPEHPCRKQVVIISRSKTRAQLSCRYLLADTLP